MKKFGLLFLLAVTMFASNVLNAQNYVKSTDGDVIFTISSANKFYLGKGYNQYEAQIKGDVLDVLGSDQETVFKKGVLYFNGEPTMKTVGGKTYSVNDDGTTEADPIYVRKGNKVYDQNNEHVFSFTKTPSDKIQTAVIFFLLLIATYAQ